MVSNSQKGNDVPTASFQLDAITLRGIGPYFHEARLEIKPLTILCGENGSGKSTWFKVLKYLKGRSAISLFPLYFLPYELPSISDFPSIVNSNVMTAADSFEGQEDYKPKIDAILQIHNPEETFGPLSTIGLEFTALTDVSSLPQLRSKKTKSNGLKTKGDADTFQHELFDFIYGGHVKSGSRFCLRISLCSEFNYGGFGEDKVSQIEMSRDGDLLFRFVSSHLIVHQALLEKSDRTPNFNESEYDIISIGLNTIREKIKPISNGNTESKEDFLDSLLDFVSSKGRMTIEQLRQIHRNLNALSESSKNRDLHLSLYCLDIFRSLTWAALSSVFLLSANRSLLDDEDESWWGDEDTKRIVESRCVGEFGENTIKIERSYAKAGMFQEVNYEVSEILERLEKKLEDRKDWRGKSENEKNKVRNRVMNPPKRSLEDVKRTLNKEERKELIDVCLDCRYRFLMHYSSNEMVYITPLYIRYWLDRIGICNSNYFFTRKQIIDDFISPPAGFHFDNKPEEVSREENSYEGDGPGSVGDRNRYSQGALTVTGGVSGLSSGFHHVLPIIVQSSVLRPGELFCVESPEIHLHPTMQLKFTEFFIEQAKNGRRYILETHSDLIVRRTLRAILEEELAQKDVHIYFTKLERIDQHPALEKLEEPMEQLTSMLELIKVNEKGQIANWPEGFLDADVAESRRLIDAMYGALGNEEDTGEGGEEDDNQ